MPRLRLLPATRWPRLGFWPAVALALWTGLVGAALALDAAGVSVSTCLFERVSGVPCPTCGGTRAAGHVLRGELGRAVALNPLLVGLGGLFGLSLACRLTFRRRPSLTWPGLPAAWKWAAAAGAVLLNWAYVVATLG